MNIEIRGAERLSFREKQVVTLKESGHCAKAIAKTLALAESTVATLYNRARAKGYEAVIVIPGAVLKVYEAEEENLLADSSDEN
ncbi:MAG: sigma-70 family RNA polymerase sigma factor [Clostridiales bacterium]|nr:sigma-70 family RNA polymerase sigma factor [Clostridiales bacterium]